MNKLLNMLASDNWGDKEAEVWENQSKRGMTHFLFRYALLIYGTVLFLGITLALILQLVNDASWVNEDKTPAEMIFFNLVVCVVVSQVYGVVAWIGNKESYRRYLMRNQK